MSIWVLRNLVLDFLKALETELHCLSPPWLHSHSGALVLLLQPERRATGRVCGRRRIPGGGKQRPPEPLGFPAFTAGGVPTLPFLLLSLPEVWGSFPPLRTKAIKLLRFGFHQESTTPPLIGRFPGLITHKQGAHASLN